LATINRNWRTAHLIVSGSAFAVWLASCIAFYGLCRWAVTEYWFPCIPIAVMPSFWCLYAWFASRRADANTSRMFMILAVPALLSGLGLAAAVAVTIAQGPQLERYDETGLQGVQIVRVCGWPIAALCGLISFVWAIVLQVKSQFQPPKEP